MKQSDTIKQHQQTIQTIQMKQSNLIKSDRIENQAHTASKQHNHSQTKVKKIQAKTS